MKTEKTPESIADGTAPAVVCSAWLGSDIYWRIFTALGEYRKEHQAAEYPNGREASKWGDHEAVARFRKEYCTRTPTSETMAIIQAWIRLDDAEQDSAGRGGRSPSAIGVMRTIDEAALTLPNNSGQTDAPKS